MGRSLGHDSPARKAYIQPMIARLLIIGLFCALLPACGGCEGRITNSGTSGGRCSVLTVPW